MAVVVVSLNKVAHWWLHLAKIEEGKSREARRLGKGFRVPSDHRWHGSARRRNMGRAGRLPANGCRWLAAGRESETGERENTG